jgi:methylenetetrahydrofolate dehydrogenase (NADP+)/methenyltetrahydrofolate cyclohydrolase
MKLKSTYGEDILVDVEVRDIDQSQAMIEISAANADTGVHGIIVQIPLPDPTQTDQILNTVDPKKDVDGLAKNTVFDAPTPVAINWLLAGYNVSLEGKHLVVVGHGRLVGKPLVRLWQKSDLQPEVVDKNTDHLATKVLTADVLVCATGVPGLITASMVKPNAVIVDAGVATDKNGLVGDVAADVRALPNITITPEKGGVGPLTVAALFENVIQAARISNDENI